MVTENILDKVQKVANYRSLVATLAIQKKASLAAWETENTPLLDTLAKAMLELTESENALRVEALKIHLETGSKAPGPGLAIRLVTRLAYDSKEALAWAIKHEVALRLDTPVFEKLAKVTTPGFVAITQEPQATIATDLEAALKEIKKEV